MALSFHQNIEKLIFFPFSKLYIAFCEYLLYMLGLVPWVMLTLTDLCQQWIKQFHHKCKTLAVMRNAQLFSLQILTACCLLCNFCLCLYFFHLFFLRKWHICQNTIYLFESKNAAVLMKIKMLYIKYYVF